MALAHDFFRCFAGTRVNRPDWDELGWIYGEETQPLDMQDDTIKSNLRANYETSQECSRGRWLNRLDMPLALKSIDSRVDPLIPAAKNNLSLFLYKVFTVPYLVYLPLVSSLPFFSTTASCWCCIVEWHFCFIQIASLEFPSQEGPSQGPGTNSQDPSPGLVWTRGERENIAPRTPWG
jgi:hypothetical protein